MRAQVRRFFLLTFAITWGMQLPAVFAQRGLLPGDPKAYLPLAGLGLLGPLIAATVLTWRERGRAGLRELYAPLLRARVHLGWYGAALVLPGLLLTGVLFAFGELGRVGPVAYVPTMGAAIFGLVISLVEEVGWRGYALPRLEAQMGPLGAAISLGLCWYFWHLPMFAGQGIPFDLALGMVLYFVGASLYLSWIRTGTQGSLLLVVLAHWGAHLNNSHRALPGDVLPFLVHAIVYGALGLYVARHHYSPSARRVFSGL